MAVHVPMCAGVGEARVCHSCPCRTAPDASTFCNSASFVRRDAVFSCPNVCTGSATSAPATLMRICRRNARIFSSLWHVSRTDGGGRVRASGDGRRACGTRTPLRQATPPLHHAARPSPTHALIHALPYFLDACLAELLASRPRFGTAVAARTGRAAEHVHGRFIAGAVVAAVAAQLAGRAGA